MLIDDLENKVKLLEGQLVWARKGNKLTRKFRCSVGKRAGRLVSSPSQCGKPIDIKKRMTLKRTKARLGARIKNKSKRTKKFNPASRALRRLNKVNRRK